ncbi:hypothetical protein [Flavobacterium terrisoli]|uniref:hypothetical protein n=1 Tax=Flavobacterium terrisoli TaxID=3242195 RepID=UPI00254271E9|nr:hypothetical protein [Flavobacterium buctense]
MTNKTKALLYNLFGFAVIFLLVLFIMNIYSGLTNLWMKITAFVISTLLAPKFQAVKTRDGDVIFMKWIFIKGVKQL